MLFSAQKWDFFLAEIFLLRRHVEPIWNTDIHFPEKCNIWRLYSEQGPNDWTKLAEIFRVSYGADLEQSSRLHEGVFERAFKTDPCAREFRQRFFIAPNMDICTLNARPLQEVKVAIWNPLGDTFQIGRAHV